MEMRPLPTCLYTSAMLRLLSFFFFFFLLSFHGRTAHVGASHAHHANLVPKVCRAAASSDPNVDYTFCVRALQAAPGSRAASVKGLAVIAVKLARANATATRSYVRRLLKAKKSRGDAYLRNCLEDCKELYTDAASQLKEVKRAIKGGRFDDANAWLSGAADAATTCEQGFEDRPGTTDPLKRRNGDMFQLAVIALSITNSLSPSTRL